MTEAQRTALKNAGIGLAIALLVYKFGKVQAVKASALGVAGVIVANQLPFVGTALKGA